MFSYKGWQKCTNEDNLQKYKLAIKEAQKGVCEAKYKVYENMHKKLGTKERTIYISFAKMRWKKGSFDDDDDDGLECLWNLLSENILSFMIILELAWIIVWACCKPVLIYFILELV